MNPAYYPTVSSPLPSSLFAPIPWCSGGQVGISHCVSVPPVPYLSPILPWPPCLPTSITPPPHRMPSPEIYWAAPHFHRRIHNGVFLHAFCRKFIRSNILCQTSSLPLLPNLYYWSWLPNPLPVNSVRTWMMSCK